MQGLLEVLQSSKKMSEHHSGTRWLNAHEDRSAGVHVFTGRCIALCDAAGTGDHGLVIAEPRLPTSGRLRMYRGAATLCSDRPLQGPPSALIAFYTDEHEPRVPAVAVAVGSDVLIYKNSKPYFKFSAPALSTYALEQDVWHRFADGAYEPNNLSNHIETLRSIPFSTLSARSQQLLILYETKAANNSEVEEYIGRYIHAEAPTKTSLVTALNSLNRHSENTDAVSCLVVATEAGHVYFLDSLAFSVVHEASACSDVLNGGSSAAVTILACSGMFDVEFRCVMCLRDGSIAILRRGWLEGKRLFHAPADSVVVDLVLIPSENFIVIALADGYLICYTKRGKKLWSIKNNNGNATCLSLVALPHLNTCLVGMGVRPSSGSGGGLIQLYQGRHLVDTIHVPDSPSAIQFGRLGQEENVLVIITSDGSLLFKILKRTADFSIAAAQAETAGGGVTGCGTPPPKPLPLPKRSKLFAEQALRERQHAQTIHQTFQQDLIRLRLSAGRATALLTGGLSSVSENVKHPVKLAAQVLGLGPRFTLTLALENLSIDRAVTDLSVIFHASPTKYLIDLPYIAVPLIPPEIRHQVETAVTEVLGSNGDEDDIPQTPIRVFVTIPGHVQPLLAATINMPPTDPLAFLV